MPYNDFISNQTDDLPSIASTPSTTYSPTTQSGYSFLGYVSGAVEVSTEV